jgi:hypothetical protein
MLRHFRVVRQGRGADHARDMARHEARRPVLLERKRVVVPLLEAQMDHAVRRVPALDEPLAIVGIVRRMEDELVDDGALVRGKRDLINVNLRRVAVPVVLQPEQARVRAPLCLHPAIILAQEGALGVRPRTAKVELRAGPVGSAVHVLLHPRRSGVNLEEMVRRHQRQGDERRGLHVCGEGPQPGDAQDRDGAQHGWHNRRHAVGTSGLGAVIPRSSSSSKLRSASTPGFAAVSSLSP